MSNVQLPIAKSVSLGTLVHVCERIPKDLLLVCPYCSSTVIKKAGSVRRHHFAHKNKSDCAVSAETLLHEGAKVYIFKCLSEGADFQIQVPVGLVSDVTTRKILECGNVSSITVTASSLTQEKFNKHYLEKSLMGFRPDVLSVLDDGAQDGFFAWEVYVTHHLEEKKIAEFRKGNVKFVELQPVEDGRNSYLFTLSNYNQVDICNMHQHVCRQIYEENKSEIINIQLDMLEESVVKEKVAVQLDKVREKYDDMEISLKRDVKKDVAEELSQNLSSFISGARGFSPSMARHFTTSFNCDVSGISTPSNCKEVKSLTKTEYHKGRFGKSVRLNGKYFLESPIRMLSSMIQTLTQSDYCRLISNHDNQIIGLNLCLPNVRSFEMRKNRVSISGEKVHNDEIDVVYADGKRSKTGKPYMTVEDVNGIEYFVKFPSFHLFNLFNIFSQNYNCKLSINDKERVFDMKCVGLPNEYLLKQSLEKIVQVNSLS